jgi:hypothetical protein
VHCPDRRSAPKGCPRCRRLWRARHSLRSTTKSSWGVKPRIFWAGGKNVPARAPGTSRMAAFRGRFTPTGSGADIAKNEAAMQRGILVRGRLWEPGPRLTTAFVKARSAGMRDRPYSLVGPGQALVAFSSRSLEGSGAPADAEGCEPSDERRARPLDGTLARRPLAPFGTRRLPALHSGVLRLTGRAFENVDQPRLSASSWRQVLMPASGAPPSPGCFRVRFPEARGAASVDGGVSPGHRPGEVEGTSPPRFSPLLRLHGVP